MCIFGGPDDLGVSPKEGLALIEPGDLASWWFGRLFLRMQPPGTTGLGRRLNPNTFYLACRWDYARTPRNVLRHSICRVSVFGGSAFFAQPVDFGPGDGSRIDGNQTQNTGRVADLSPALAAALGLQTDDNVTVELFAALPQ